MLKDPRADNEKSLYKAFASNQHFLIACAEPKQKRNEPKIIDIERKKFKPGVAACSIHLFKLTENAFPHAMPSRTNLESLSRSLGIFHMKTKPKSHDTCLKPRRSSEGREKNFITSFNRVIIVARSPFVSSPGLGETSSVKNAFLIGEINFEKKFNTFENDTQRSRAWSGKMKFNWKKNTRETARRIRSFSRDNCSFGGNFCRR